MESQNNSEFANSSTFVCVSNLSYSIVNRSKLKRILRGISFALTNGDMCAILGPSGAGKSSLLDLIAQRNKNGIWSGNIAVGGNSIQATNKAHGLAYVYQSDMLIATLTVEETIRYSTWLHLSSSLSDFEKESRVQSIITQLSLDRVRKNKVFDEVTQCGLSGGERKRLSIATQIVADPRFIMLDEPTSGLDSALSMEVMSTVRKFCTKERTVLTTIHQPSRAIFALFDKVLILVQGRIIFYGTSSDAITHFSSTNIGYKFTNKYQNPSEFILDICRGQISPENSNIRMLLTDLVGAYENSIYYKATISTVHTEFARILNNNNNNNTNSTSTSHNKTDDNDSNSTPNFSIQGIQSLFEISSLSNSDSSKADIIQYARSTLSQILILTYRNWKSKIRNKSDLKSHVIKNISLGILWGLIFFQKGDPNGPFYENGYSEAKVQTTNSLLLQITVFAVYTNLSMVDSLTQSTALYHREVGNQSYSPLAYALSQALSTLPIQLATIFILIFAMYFLSGLPPSGEYFFFLYLCTFIAVYCSFTMTLALTAWVGDISLVYMIVPVAADIMVSLSGYAPQVENMPSFYEGLSYLNLARWQFQSMMINHWTRYDTDDSTGYDENGNGDVLEDFDFDGIHKFNCLWILLLFTLVSLIIFYWGVLPAKSRLHKVSNAEDARIVLAKVVATQSQQDSFLNDFIPQISSTGDLKEKLIVHDSSQLVEEEPAVLDHRAPLTVHSFSQSRTENDLSEGCTLVFRSVSAPPLRGVGVDDEDSIDYDSVSSLSDISGSEKIPPVRTTATSASTIPTPKTMYVQGASGIVLPGEMCAIMGSSGAGKSSLLNILSQRKNGADYSGKVYYNGTLGVLPPFGFVTQDDLHVDVMTVREALEFAGELRLPEGMPKEEKQRRVERILSILLLQSVANNIVGGQFRHGISGGELKRLSIGVELLHFPGLMFLDEPTTGLDSSTSLEVLSALRNLANQQRTIIMTLHQPSQDMFQLFDKILIMAASRVVYFGGVNKCEKFFTESPYAFAFPNTMDVAEYMIASAGSFIPSADGRTVPAGELAAYYASSTECLAVRDMIRALQKSYQRDNNTSNSTDVANTSNEIKTVEPHLSLKYQLQVLLGRRYLIIRRNWRTYMWKGVKEIVLAIIIGTIWWRISTGSAEHVYTDRFSVINKIVVHCTARNMNPFAIFEDRRFYYKERTLNAYSPLAYWLTCWIPQIPISIGYGFLFSSIVYIFSGLRAGIKYYAIYQYFSIMADIVAYFLFSMVTALCASPYSARHYLPLLQMSLITMSGFSEYFPDMQVWVKMTTYGVVSRYIFQGLVLNELQNNGNLPESHRYIVTLGFTGISIGGCAAMMLLFIGIFMFIYYLALKYVDYEHN